LQVFEQAQKDQPVGSAGQGAAQFHENVVGDEDSAQQAVALLQSKLMARVVWIDQSQVVGRVGKNRFHSRFGTP
jgi:hypothetical protein